MHAYILTGGSENERSERITSLLSERSVSPFDTISIIPDTPFIGVDTVRGVTIRLSIHPVISPCHAVVIRNAHTMTPEAQNAFLKTLEEPPGDAIIILETSQPDALLPTILSRCQLVNLGTVAAYADQEILQCIDTLKYVREASIGCRLQKIDTIAKTHGDALAFVELAIAALQKELSEHRHHAKLLRSLLTARTQILGNITPKLALDAVFFS
ncbi:hypothetical protein HY087_01530 [Candidatus Gottesmanbacteria bacterium]|nr:hypothetical protein [Candidatus Gottesmanbacteria bacterium]